MPEPGKAPPDREPAEGPPPPAAPDRLVLGRLELELPDGRYLIAYRHLEPASADA